MMNILQINDFVIFSYKTKMHLSNTLSDRDFDPIAKNLVKKWSTPAKSIQVLEVLDICIFSSLTSNFYITILTILYHMCLKNEGVTHSDLQKLAVWRKNF